MNSLFPPNPKHRMTVEIQPGILFQYDATINSWIKLTTNGLTIQLASHAQSGGMSAADLKKLNRLVLPPPISSIIGTDCVNPFQLGVIGLYSGDKFVEVNGTVDVRNVDDKGNTLSETLPFQIHKHTYGFDFTIDLPSLVDELQHRGQFNVIGKKGATGATGPKGEAGPDMILSGPPGGAGVGGSAPVCDLSVEPDSLAVAPRESSKALVAANIVPDGTGQYKIVFDRQSIGLTGVAAEQFNVQADISPWLLAISGNQVDGQVTGTGPSLCSDFASASPQSVYYVDVEPLLASIRQQFLSRVDILKTGYESVVKFWIQTMSDLFDEQKSALCCSLEHCMSVSKNAALRQQIDSLAATAAGSANILLHNKQSSEAVSMSSTRLLKDAGGADTCRGGPPFPQFPNLHGGQTPPASSAALSSSTLTAEAVPLSTDRAIITIDPLINVSAATGVQVPLQAGNYSIIVTKAEASSDGKYKADVRFTYFDGGVKRVVKFLDKGEFNNITDSKAAYEGLSLSFTHDGGMVAAWLPNFNPKRVGGIVELQLQPTEPVQVTPLVVKPVEAIKVKKQKKDPVQLESMQLVGSTVIDCRMSVSHLAWYERGWLSGNCCGVVINVMGQDFIVVKRSIGMDQGCGGGETESEPCIAAVSNHPAFAWPTLDGKTFAPLPDAEYVTFSFDERLNDIATDKIANDEIVGKGGQLTGTRNLSFHLSTILFPVHL